MLLSKEGLSGAVLSAMDTMLKCKVPWPDACWDVRMNFNPLGPIAHIGVMRLSAS